MRSLVYILSAIVALAVAAPQDAVAPVPASIPVGNSAPNSAYPSVEIVSQSDVVNADGSFNYSYELSNGVRVQESGVLRHDPNAPLARSGDAGEGDDSGDIQAVQGSYSYTAPDGTVISLTYVADENGFQPQGDHLPTAPPVPAAIQRALEAVSATDSAPQQPQQQPLQPQPSQQPIGAPAPTAPEAPPQ